MKTQNLILSLTLAALATWATGCKEETKSATEQTREAASSASDAATKATDSAKQTGSTVIQDVTDKAKEVASTKAQELIDSAKSLVGAGKFQEALAKLQEIGGEKLSLNQQTMVDALKAQIENALGATSKTATDAAAAAGNLLKK